MIISTRRAASIFLLGVLGLGILSGCGLQGSGDGDGNAVGNGAKNNSATSKAGESQRQPARVAARP